MQSLVAVAVAGLSASALMFGAAVWFRRALKLEFSRGELFGRAACAAEAAAEAFVRRQADEALVAISNADVAALESERDRLEEGLYGLEREIAGAGDGPVCFGPGLVRSLAASRDGSDARSQGP